MDEETRFCGGCGKRIEPKDLFYSFVTDAEMYICSKCMKVHNAPDPKEEFVKSLEPYL